MAAGGAAAVFGPPEECAIHDELLEKGEGRVARASVPALSAYVVSKIACGKLLDLVRAALDRPLGEAVAAADLVTYAAQAPPVVSSGMASSVASTPEFSPVPTEE